MSRTVESIQESREIGVIGDGKEFISRGHNIDFQVKLFYPVYHCKRGETQAGNENFSGPSHHILPEGMGRCWTYGDFDFFKESRVGLDTKGLGDQRAGKKGLSGLYLVNLLA